ncbi:gamma-glutamyl-gamma-aminobutyrate hydrolase family protein [Amycolatopsis sp., V23-08]|uniref:Gamma-glutamyl-gamma-aminobutyrate hydrolase family protein n=1 Tax=Amycolatopsis heterodermiae TaxID=3110235 RepID=A0ABU5R455_9PSEU|nr:gamma-glutamyl-gamma-aminobutyrate hydrolase family protein [Amycolatopsis sp., V23-08]MEA5360948.1 gamma-glutamyl-gamma-aminobutyrate hydrolase family protein [Amycolatopsis sp., V23-08]
MSARPLVALAASEEFVDGVPHVAVREVYVRALERVSGCAVAVVGGPAPDLAELLGRFDGVVFGGHQTDVEPARYGGPSRGGPADPARDELALRVLPAALRAGVPVLGICRGLQELNVALGGTLRDLPDDAHREDLSQPRDRQYRPVHEVHLSEGGLLRQLLGYPHVPVNSLHHQAIDRVAPDLRVEAVAADGVVEAGSAGDGFCLAVQWHPEWYAGTDPVSTAIFHEFGVAARLAAMRRDQGFPLPRPMSSIGMNS